MKTWTREETIVAFYVYCKIPFKDSDKSHPIIKEFAQIIGRTPSALNMKVGNIGRLDPDLQKKGIVGLTHGAKMEEEIWREFCDNPERLAYESEKIIAKLRGKSVEESVDFDTSNLPQGGEREIVVKQRINQSFFRMAVLSSYNNRCCISGIGNRELLEACHIVDWSENIANRTNPKNGLCMNPFFHKAYDKLFIAVTPDLTIIVSDELLQNTTDDKFKNYLKCLNGGKIIMPGKFYPEKDFLQAHYEEFKKQW